MRRKQNAISIFWLWHRITKASHIKSCTIQSENNVDYEKNTLLTATENLPAVSSN